MLSVSALAWSTGNLFNGIVFGAMAVVSCFIALSLKRKSVSRGPAWATSFGVASLAFAWFYPHFLDSQPAAVYLIASPMGLIPCPTLTMVAAFGLMAHGLDSRAWSLMVAMAGLFYALFGIFRLEVWLDVGLFGASIALLMLSFTSSLKDSHQTPTPRKPCATSSNTINARMGERSRPPTGGMSPLKNRK
jgi:hypothetical protein